MSAGTVMPATSLKFRSKIPSEERLQSSGLCQEQSRIPLTEGPVNQSGHPAGTQTQAKRPVSGVCWTRTVLRGGLIPGSKIKPCYRTEVWSSRTTVMLNLRTWGIFLVWGQDMSSLGEARGAALESTHL